MSRQLANHTASSQVASASQSLSQGATEQAASLEQTSASMEEIASMTRMNAEIDVRHVLPSIRVPSLILHRTGDLCLKVEEGRYVADRIPGSRFVELPGVDHLPFVGDQDARHGRIPIGCL